MRRLPESADSVVPVAMTFTHSLTHSLCRDGCIVEAFFGWKTLKAGEGKGEPSDLRTGPATRV